MERNNQRLFERYYGPVYGFFVRRGFSAQDAEDLAQETLFHVFREIGSVRRGASFKAWLFTIAANVYRNELRRRDREKRSGWEVPLEQEGREDLRPFDSARSLGASDEQRSLVGPAPADSCRR